MRKRTRVVTAALVILTVAGAGAAIAKSKNGGGKSKENTVAVERGDLVDKALAVGTIVPLVEVSVKSRISGVVSERFAGPGDYVKAGTPLLQIHPTPTPLERVEAKRSVELEEIRLANQDEEIKRSEALLARGLVSQQEYDAKKRTHAEAALQVQIAKERLALLEEGKFQSAKGNFKTVVEAPIDGYILEKMVETGDPVVPLSSYQEGTVLMTMADMKDLVFRGTVDEIDVGRLREGMPVEIKVGALPKDTVSGKLSKISLKARKEENTTVFPVEIALTETHGVVLRAGYSANADVIIDRREKVLIIPERVVTFAADTARVTLRLPSGKTEERTITTGLSDAIHVEVLDGLAEGDVLVEKPVKEIK